MVRKVNLHKKNSIQQITNKNPYMICEKSSKTTKSLYLGHPKRYAIPTLNNGVKKTTVDNDTIQNKYSLDRLTESFVSRLNFLIISLSFWSF